MWKRKCTASSAWLDILDMQAALMMFCYCVLHSCPLFLFSSPILLFMATALVSSLFYFETLSWKWIASGSMGVQDLGSTVRSVFLCDLSEDTCLPS